MNASGPGLHDRRERRAPVPAVVMQHVGDAIHLRHTRSILVRAPRVGLSQLARLDHRLATHLSGIRIADAYGARLSRSALERPEAGALFVAAVIALESGDVRALDRLLSVAEALPEASHGLLSAFGWVSAAIARDFGASPNAGSTTFCRRVALRAAAMHGIQPIGSLAECIDGDDEMLRAEALRAAGRLACVDLLEYGQRWLTAVDPRSAFEAARAVLLLGDRSTALVSLRTIAKAGGAHAGEALDLLLRSVSEEDARALLVEAFDAGMPPRALIHAVGVAGDPAFVPWLVDKMANPELARIAGEALTTITGADLVASALDGAPPEDVADGPNADPLDADVALDRDEGLPWPDPGKIVDWWRGNAGRFQPGVRHFLGAPPSVPHCAAILESGFQRQRLAAAEHLRLLAPRTPLFNVAAPAWRQRQLLAQRAR